VRTTRARRAGGGSNDVLIGGLSDDTLIGRGRDLLIGDAPNDSLLGDSGEDLLIGGITPYNYGVVAFDPPAEAGLAAIMVEWTSAHDYPTRIDKLVNGGGLNGDFTLTPDATAFDDASANVLNGNGGRDLFFADLLDTIAHRRPNEAGYSL
jgi:Ca2+-binding RTX toxin-like protein